MTDRFNTIAGWVLFAGIVALGLSILSGMFFHADTPERPETMGYPIAGVVEEGEGGDGPPLALLLAQGSAEAGEKVFAKCTSCHTANQGGANGIGPNLYGVLGKPIGKHAAGFAYSSALAEKGGTWDYAAMDEWLKSPRAFAPGTKMSFAGLSSAEDRANVILYALANGGGPALPEVPAEDAAAGEEGAATEAGGPGGEGQGESGDPSAGAGPAAAAGAAPRAGVEAAGAVAAPQPVDDTGATNPVGGN